MHHACGFLHSAYQAAAEVARKLRLSVCWSGKAGCECSETSPDAVVPSALGSVEKPLNSAVIGYHGSVRSRGSLPRAPPADRFPSPFLSDQESRHGLPALPLVVDPRAGGPSGSWLPALYRFALAKASVPELRAAVQRADRHGAEPGPGSNRHRVPVVFWRLRYKLSLRDLAEMFLIRGIVFTHEAVRDWEARLAPLLAKGLRKRRIGKAGRCWHIDETHLKVAGEWCYLYRAIDRDGNLVDVYLSETRDMAAAKAFLRSARSVTQLEPEPEQVTTDGHT